MFLMPTNVDVPAFHEGFADLVALFLHFTYADVVEQAIRQSRGALRQRLAAHRPRPRIRLRALESPAGDSALRSGVDVEGLAAFDSDVPPAKDRRPLSYDDAGIEPHALGLGARLRRLRGVHDRRQAEDRAPVPHRRLGPEALGRVPLSDALVKAHRAGGQRRRRAVPQRLHPRHRLLPAGRHGARRVPAGADHRRQRDGSTATSGDSAKRSCARSGAAASFPITCSS